jgi:hypothetical protein
VGKSRVAVGLCLVAAAVLAALALRRPEQESATPVSSSTERTARPVASRSHHRGVVLDCSTRSEANFPGAFADRRNLVVGPLVLVGAGEPTPADVIREFGGNKFPLLVKAGHTVTLRLPTRTRDFAGLAYGPQPPGRTKLRDTHRTMTFIACRAGRATPDYKPDGPSGSFADGVSITFWSGFVVTRRPACLPLEVRVDGERAARHAVLNLGSSYC